jgi:hypothetical protein
MNQTEKDLADVRGRYGLTAARYRISQVKQLLNWSNATFWRKAKAGQIRLVYDGSTPYVMTPEIARILYETEHSTGPSPKKTAA